MVWRMMIGAMMLFYLVVQFYFTLFRQLVKYIRKQSEWLRLIPK